MYCSKVLHYTQFSHPDFCVGIKSQTAWDILRCSRLGWVKCVLQWVAKVLIVGDTAQYTGLSETMHGVDMYLDRAVNKPCVIGRVHLWNCEPELESFLMCSCTSRG